MRRLFISGNWKMNTTTESATRLVRGIVERFGTSDELDIGVFPPFLYLQAVMREAAKSAVIVGAQNMHYEASGAYTGEVSATMLKDIGCRWVLLGHSERRHIFGEKDDLVNL